MVVDSVVANNLVNNLVSKLAEFGFTRTDALVYIALLKYGKSSGYKIAKEIGLSRSSVYSSIDSLYLQQCIYLSDSQTKEYSAKAPNILFEELRKKTVESCTYLKNELNKIYEHEESEEFIFNLTSYDAWLRKVKEGFSSSQKEIYLNTDFDLELFSEDIKLAVERGIRIIIFSFNRIKKVHPAIELYTRLEEDETLYPSSRFMMVVDMKTALIFSNSNSQSQGVFTNNDLMLKIVAEHIHSDIYLTQYESLHNADIKKLLINTLHEQVNNLRVYEKLNEEK